MANSVLNKFWRMHVDKLYTWTLVSLGTKGLGMSMSVGFCTIWRYRIGHACLSFLYKRVGSPWWKSRRATPVTNLNPYIFLIQSQLPLGSLVVRVDWHIVIVCSPSFLGGVVSCLSTATWFVSCGDNSSVRNCKGAPRVRSSVVSSMHGGKQLVFFSLVG